jgi:hypothetical protein
MTTRLPDARDHTEDTASPTGEDLNPAGPPTALCPSSTLLLARVVLAERIGRGQLAGLGLAAVAVGLLAVG